MKRVEIFLFEGGVTNRKDIIATGCRIQRLDIYTLQKQRERKFQLFQLRDLFLWGRVLNVIRATGCRIRRGLMLIIHCESTEKEVSNYFSCLKSDFFLAGGEFCFKGRFKAFWPASG